jgi:5-methylcytosine-specific restriction endonuclease McrA
MGVLKMADIRNKKLRKEIFDYYGTACASCGCGDKDMLQVDHVDPQCNLGSDKAHNLQLLCMVCNIIKGDTLGCIRMAPRTRLTNCDNWQAGRRKFRKHIYKLRRAG